MRHVCCDGWVALTFPSLTSRSVVLVANDWIGVVQAFLSRNRPRHLSLAWLPSRCDVTGDLLHEEVEKTNTSKDFLGIEGPSRHVSHAAGGVGVSKRPVRTHKQHP